MPGNGFTLAVRVSGQIEAIGALKRLGDLANMLLGFVVDLPTHGEVVIRTDRSIFRRQVADMSIAGENGIIATQVLINGFCFRRGLDNDNTAHGNSNPSQKSRLLIRSARENWHFGRQCQLTICFATHPPHESL